MISNSDREAITSGRYTGVLLIDAARHVLDAYDNDGTTSESQLILRFRNQVEKIQVDLNRRYLRERIDSRRSIEWLTKEKQKLQKELSTITREVVALRRDNGWLTNFYEAAGQPWPQEDEAAIMA